MHLLLAALGVAGVCLVDVPAACSSADLALTLDAGPARFKSGEPIRLELTVSRRSSGDVTLSFATGQRFDFRIDDPAGQTRWQWSADRMFAQALGQVQLSAQQPELRYGVTAVPKLPRGRYRVYGWLTSSPPTAEVAADIVIE